MTNARCRERRPSIGRAVALLNRQDASRPRRGRNDPRSTSARRSRSGRSRGLRRRAAARWPSRAGCDRSAAGSGPSRGLVGSGQGRIPTRPRRRVSSGSCCRSSCTRAIGIAPPAGATSLASPRSAAQPAASIVARTNASVRAAFTYARRRRLVEWDSWESVQAPALATTSASTRPRHRLGRSGRSRAARSTRAGSRWRSRRACVGLGAGEAVTTRRGEALG